MSLYDVIIRHGMLINSTGISQADLAIADGRIVAIEPELGGASKEEIDARGMQIFPGVIDSNVFFNEQRRNHLGVFFSRTPAPAPSRSLPFFSFPSTLSPPTFVLLF